MSENGVRERKTKMRNFMKIRALTAMLSLGLVLSTASAEASRFFRYKDDAGKLVLSHTIPNERVRFGYEIVDEHGRLIQKVAPQLSDDAYKAKLRYEAAKSECLEELGRIKRLYQTQVDIDKAEEQALASIDTRISNARAQLKLISTQKKELETQAAQLDIAGKKISSMLLDNIARAKSQERNLEQEIELRFQEKLDLRVEFNYHRRVFTLPDCEKGLPA